jgi:DnaJ family protein C protein 11
LKISDFFFFLSLHRHHKSNDEELMESADQQFKLVKTAHETLTDETKRHLYDTFGERGLQDAMALTTHNPLMSKEELHSKLSAQQVEEREKLDRRQANVHGLVKISTSAGALGRVLRGEQSLSDEAGITVAHSMEIPVGDNDTLKLGGSVYAEDSAGLAAVSARWKRSFNDAAQTYGFVSLKTSGANSLASVGMSRRLSEEIEACTAFRASPSRGFGVKTKLVRHFSPTTTAQLACTIGFGSSVSVSFKRQIGEMGHIKAHVQAWDDNARASVSRHFASTNGAVSADVGLKLSTRVGEDHSFAIEVGGDRMVTARAGVGLKLSFSSSRVVATLRLRRDGHTLSLPVLISDYVDRWVVAASLVVPTVVLTLVQALIIAPTKRRAKIERILKMREANAAYTAKCRKEAEAAVKLLSSTVASKRRFESSVKGGGLIIVSAQYGQLDPAMQFDAEEAERFESRQNARRRARESMAGGEPDAAADAARATQKPWIDVTTPLQYFVEDSELHLHAGCKSSLLGFYDPCPGEEKTLRVVYRFKNRLHEVEIDDEDELAAPKKSHLASE